MWPKVIIVDFDVFILFNTFLFNQMRFGVNLKIMNDMKNIYKGK